MALIDLLWALIGLILTISGTFVEAFVATPDLGKGLQTVQTYPLGVTYQIGAVLFVGCMGGQTAAVLSQVAYLVLGLVGFQIFSQGGGIGYLREPSFGYLLGFIPAAWICGRLAFKALPRLEALAFSCLCGLLGIHGTGILYLILAYNGGWLKTMNFSLQAAILRYSLYPLPGQLAIVCAVTVIAFLLRHLMLY
ncbi:MAG: biotin transporter BioY [Leptolyngbyaceae cyanobacterium]